MATQLHSFVLRVNVDTLGNSTTTEAENEDHQNNEREESEEIVTWIRRVHLDGQLVKRIRGGRPCSFLPHLNARFHLLATNVAHALSRLLIVLRPK